LEPREPRLGFAKAIPDIVFVDESCTFTDRELMPQLARPNEINNFFIIVLFCIYPIPPKMQTYLKQSQNQQLPEHKRYEYLVAAKLNLLMWEDAKDKVCAKFDIPETRDYGIDLVSPDFTKVAQVKCFTTTKIG